MEASDCVDRRVARLLQASTHGIGLEYDKVWVGDDLLGIVAWLSKVGEAYPNKLPVACYPAPTLYTAAKWLREERGIHVEVGTDMEDNNEVAWYATVALCGQLPDDNTGNYHSYEDALNAGIELAITTYKDYAGA